MAVVSAVLALLCSLTWGTSDFLGGLLSRRLPAAAVVGASQVVGLVAMTVTVLVVAVLGHPVPFDRWAEWAPYAVAAGVTGSIALAAFYAGLSAGTMGVVAPIAATGAAVPVLLGVLTGDQPTTLAWAGMVVAVLGTILASGPELRAGVSVRPVLLAVVAALGFGTVLFLVSRGSHVSSVATLWGMRLTSTTLYVVLALRLRTVGGTRAADLRWLLPIGLGDLGANALFATASGLGMVSVVAVLSSLYPVVTILLARVLLHERLQRIQVVGVVVSLAGVAALSVA